MAGTILHFKSSKRYQNAGGANYVIAMDVLYALKPLNGDVEGFDAEYLGLMFFQQVSSICEWSFIW